MFGKHLIILWDVGTEATGEKGGYYDLLFTYGEGAKASYFISDEPEGSELTWSLRCWRGQRKPNGFKSKRIGYGTRSECDG